MTEKRIGIFDGLRVVAILMVLVYHYYSMFDGKLYNYSFDVPEIFHYGYLGVELFFIISGFVIFLTLTKCETFIEFIKKRFLRLIPAMLICSTITFIVISIFDTNSIFPNSKQIGNLLLSYSFIPYKLFNFFFGTDLRYTDGPYWSLWTELQFYFIAGSLYFWNQKNFLNNFILIILTGVLLFFVFISSFGLNLIGGFFGKDLFLSIRTFFDIFTFFEYGIWFLIGVLINLVFCKVDVKKNSFLLIVFFSIQMILLMNFYAILFTFIMMIVFLLFLFKPNYIQFLSNKFVARIGVASYSIYLIHSAIGLFTIIKLSPYFGNYNWLLPLFVIIATCFFGLLSYKYLEVPLGKKLKNLFFRK